MKKVILLMFTLLLSGCSVFNKPLAEPVNDPETVVEYDITKELDPSLFLKDVQEDAQVTYEINEEENKVVFTIAKGDKTETYETNLNIVYPEYSVDENITVDKTLGYNIEDYIHCDDNTKYTYDFNEDTGVLRVNFTNGSWSKDVETKFNVIESMPLGIYVSDEWVNPTASRWPDTKDAVVIVFLDGGRGYICSYDLNRPTAGHIPIAFSWDESGNIAYYMAGDDYTYKLASGGNGRTATFEYKDGVLTEYLSDNEYITYHHVDSYSTPGVDPYALYEVYYQDLEADYNTCIEARHNNYKLIGQ